MRLPTPALAPLVALALLAGGAAAQEPDEKLPARPRLAAGQDTNSAIAYYEHGRARIQKHASEAADAFYWASRLAPQWADPYYARRIALLMANKHNLLRYMRGERGIVESREYRQIDSLHYQALLRNPFVVQNLDRVLVDEVVYRVSGGGLPMYGGRSGDPAYDGWSAYTGGQYARAIDHYGRAIKKDPKALLLHASRARAFAALAMYAGAADEITQLLAKLDEKQKKKLVWFFDSRVMYEYALGSAHVLAGDDSAAKEAYGRALTEDLSFHMAHAALAELALRAGDVATAVSEYGLAVQLREEDGALRFGHAMALLKAGKPVEASRELTRATELEPWFAMPWLYLGRLYDASEMTEEARRCYDQFLARAAQDLTERQWAEQRLAQIVAAAP